MKRARPDIYLFCTGLVRAMEGRFFSAETVRRLIYAGSLSSAADILKGTLAGDFLKADETADINRIILNARKQLLSFTESLSHDPELISIIRAPYDFHNIKVLLKSKILDMESHNLSDLGSVSTDYMKSLFEKEDYDKLPPVIYHAVVSAIEEYYTEKNLSVTDFIIDSAMFSYVSERSESLASPFVSDYLHILADIFNISSWFRLQRLNTEMSIRDKIFIPHGLIPSELFIEASDSDKLKMEIKGLAHAERLIIASDEFENNPFVLERETDIILSDELKKTGFLIHGVEPLFAFFERMNLELRVCGTILSCYSTGLGPDFMKLRITEDAF